MVTQRFVGAVSALRFVIALIVGLIVGFLVAENAKHIDRSGVTISELTVTDTTGAFDTGPFQRALNEVVFSRDYRALLYVAPQPGELAGDCAYVGLRCMGEGLSSTYFVGSRLRADALVIWVDPQLRTVEVDMGYVDQEQYATMFEAESFASSALTHEFTDGQIEAAKLEEVIQILADVESGFDYSTHNKTPWLAWLTGLAAFTLSFLLVTIGGQVTNNRRYVGSMTGVSRNERRQRVQQARDVFTEASHALEKIELTALGEHLGSYRSAMEQRVETWRDDYLDLSETILETAGLSDREISSIRNRRLVARLSHSAQIVQAGMDRLEADDAWLKACATGASVPPENRPDHELNRAINIGYEIAEKARDETLGDGLNRLTSALEQGEQAGPKALANWDSVAARLLTLIENFVAHHQGERGELEPIITDLALDIAQIEVIVHGRQATYLKDDTRPQRTYLAHRIANQNLDEDAKPTQTSTSAASRRTGSIPVPPLLVLLSLGISIAVGVYAQPDSQVENPTEESNILLPADLETGSLSPLPAIDVTTEDDASIATVDIDDQANLLDDDLLAHELTRIPFQGPTSFQILTTDQALPGGELTPQARLAEIFPDYFDPDFDTYLGEANYVIILAAGGDETAILSPYGTELGFNEHWYPAGELQAAGEDADIAVWNAVASASNILRGAQFDTGQGDVETREEELSVPWLWAIGAFIASLVALTLINYLLQRRRRHQANEQELAAIMTTMALSHDALELTMNSVEQKWPGQVGDRNRNWHANYLQVLRQCHEADTEKHEFGGSPRQVRENLRNALYLQAQRESLYRAANIAAQRPGWIDLVVEELRILHWADPGAATSARDEIVRQLGRNRKINPSLILSALHAAALESARGIAWWCLKESGPQTFATQARQFANVSHSLSGVNVGTYFLVDRYVFSSGQEQHVPQFIDIDMGSLAWMKQAGEYVSLAALDKVRALWRFMRTSGSRYAKAITVGLVLGGLLLMSLVLSLVLSLMTADRYGVLEFASDPDVRPLETGVIGVEADRQADITTVLSDIPIGIPQRIVFFASETRCDNGEPGVQGLDTSATEFEPFIVNYNDRHVLREGTTLVCFSDTDTSVIRESISVDVDRLNDAISEVDMSQGVADRMLELATVLSDFDEPILQRSNYLSAPYAQAAGY